MRRRLTLILLIAIAIRALLPPGFMLAPADDGANGFQVVICTSQGMKLVTLDENGKPVEQRDGPLADSTACVYGPPPISLAAAAAVDFAVEMATARIAQDRARHFLLKRRTQEIHLARGPPRRASI